MKAMWTLALSVVLLAGCGTSPVGTKVAGTTASQAQANGLFSSFKEADYQETVSVRQINAFMDQDDVNQANAGKKFKAEGDLNYSVGDMQLVDANDVTLTLSGEGGSYAYLHRERFMFRGASQSFIKKVGGDQQGTSTVYFTVKTGNLNSRIHVDAIKRPDGTLVKL